MLMEGGGPYLAGVRDACTGGGIQYVHRVLPDDPSHPGRGEQLGCFAQGS